MFWFIVLCFKVIILGNCLFVWIKFYFIYYVILFNVRVWLIMESLMIRNCICKKKYMLNNVFVLMFIKKIVLISKIMKD